MKSDQTRVIPLFNIGSTSLNFKYMMLTTTKVGIGQYIILFVKEKAYSDSQINLVFVNE